MKCTIPEISWHNRDPVLTVDIQQKSPDGIYRVATGGTDAHIEIWQFQILDNGGVSVEALSELTHHNRAVNIVRFSPDGTTLASGDDEAVIILWKKQENALFKDDIFANENDKHNKESWTIHKLLRGHIEDIIDLSWSNCSQFLISGSVDNAAIIWDVSKGKNIGLLKDHKGFVQGVSWDPKGQYIATIGTDRAVRIYSSNTKRVLNKIQKVPMVVKSGEEKKEKVMHLFYDDTFKSFSRRLSFSPDGELLVIPSGIIENEDETKSNVTHIFSRYDFSRPVMYLPSKGRFTVAVRFCPILFQLRRRPQEEKLLTKNGNKLLSVPNMFDLPYRMVFAVATQSAVLLYDTQQAIPFAKILDIHYTRLSDLSWSDDGQLLVVSSTDGYCSLISFNKGELGVPFSPVDNRIVPSGVNNEEDTQVMSTEAEHSASKEEMPMDVALEEVPMECDGMSEVPSELESHVSHSQSGSVSKVESSTRTTPSSKQGKRVQLITLSTKLGSDASSSKEIGKSPANKWSKAPPKPQDTDSKAVQGNQVTEQPSSDTNKSPSKGTSSNLHESPSKTPSNSKGPRRVSLITLSSPKSKKSLLNDSR